MGSPISKTGASGDAEEDGLHIRSHPSVTTERSVRA
jgi:hypothetical protein